MTSRRITCALWLLIAGCADLSRGGPAPDTGDAAAGGATSDAALSFATDVEVIMKGSCQRCHAAGREAGDTTLLLTGNAVADRTAVVSLIDLTSPAQSRLLLKMSGNGHGGGTLFAVGAPEYQTVLLWIQQGASP